MTTLKTIGYVIGAIVVGIITIPVFILLQAVAGGER